MTKDEAHQHMAWEQDYHLQDPGRMALFDEYLEMSKREGGGILHHSPRYDYDLVSTGGCTPLNDP